MSDWERARAFLRDTYRRRVEYVESYPWGELVITPSLPRVYDANFAIVERWAGDAAGLRREMNRVQSEHGFAHRKVVLALGFDPIGVEHVVGRPGERDT